MFYRVVVQTCIMVSTHNVLDSWTLKTTLVFICGRVVEAVLQFRYGLVQLRMRVVSSLSNLC